MYHQPTFIRRFLAAGLGLCLLTALFAGCQKSGTDTGSSTGPTEITTVSPSTEEPASSEITDAASLAKAVQAYISENKELTLSSDGEGAFTATVSSDIDTSEIEADYRYYNFVVSDKSVEESSSLGAMLEGYTSSYDYTDAIFLYENGTPYTYLELDDGSYIKVAADFCEEACYLSDIFDRLADGRVSAEYSFEENDYEMLHFLDMELTGDALHDLLVQMAYPCANLFDLLDWNAVTAKVHVEVPISDYSGPRHILFQIESQDLAEAVFGLSDHLEKVENANFTAELEYYYDEYYEMELPAELSDAVELSKDDFYETTLIDYIDTTVLRRRDRVLADQFESIETYDPVTLTCLTASMTISLPSELGLFDDFHQSTPYQVMLTYEGLRSGRTIFALEEGSANYILAQVQERYQDSDSGSLSDLLTLETDLGQVSYLVYTKDSENSFGKSVRTLEYTAVLPLENGIYLKLTMETTYNPSGETQPINELTLETLFRHCALGEEASALSDQETARRFSSLEEFLNDPDNAALCETLGTSLAGDGVSVTTYVEGANLVFRFELSPLGAGMELDMDKTSLRVQLAITSQSSGFKKLAKSLKRDVSLEGTKVILGVYTSDGREIYSEEFIAD